MCDHELNIFDNRNPGLVIVFGRVAHSANLGYSMVNVAGGENEVTIL